MTAENIQHDPAMSAEAEDTRIVLCTKISDLFLSPSRSLAGLLFRDFLDEIVVTPTEVLHSAKLQSKLDHTGSLVRMASEKAAVMQAKVTPQSIPKRALDIASLFVDLCLITRTIEDKEPVIPLQEGELAAKMAKIRATSSDQETGTRRIFRMVTNHLADAGTWDKKFEKLFMLLEEAVKTEEISLFDQLLADVIQSNEARDVIFGTRRINIGDKINDLLMVYKCCYKATAPKQEIGEGKQEIGEGKQEIGEGKQEIAIKLNTFLQNHLFQETRDSIETVIVRYLATRDHLQSSELIKELQATKKLFSQLAYQNGSIGGKRALDFIDRRMGRLINDDTITGYLRGAPTVADRIITLLKIYNETFDKTSRNIVETYINRYIGDEDLERRLTAGEGSPQHKLRLISELYKTISTVQMDDVIKGNFMAKLIKIQSNFVVSSKLFAIIEKQPTINTAQKFEKVVTMCNEGVFIPGENLDRARTLAKHYLHQPNFINHYFANTRDTSVRQIKLDKLKQTLTQLKIQAPFIIN